MIYVVTNRNLIKKDSIYNVVENVVKNGADGIILREKDLSYASLLSMSKKIKSITDKYNVPLIINGNIDIALNIKAFGFHTNYEIFKKIKFKNNIYEKLKIGVSVHSIEEAKKAESLGANYLLAGHIFETDCKKGLKGRGLEFIKEMHKNILIPIIAIGGINCSNLKDVLSNGACGAAIMSSAMTNDGGRVVKNLKLLLVR